jgi:hypothetical protein
VPARLRRIIAVAREYGVDVKKPKGGGSHWMAKKAGCPTYPLPAHNAEKSEISDRYIEGFCRNFEIDLEEFEAKL